MKMEINNVEISAKVEQDGKILFSIEDWSNMAFISFHASKEEVEVFRDKLNELLQGVKNLP